MSHGIQSTDGMMSVRDVPWHKSLTGDLTVVRAEYPSTAEALKDSNMGWGVNQETAYRRVLLDDPDGGEPIEMFVPMKDADDVEWRYNVRSDTGGVIGVVTSDYTPVQNLEAFNFLDALLAGGDNPDGSVQWETCGTLWGGKRVWVLARVPEHVMIAGDETVPFIYCANSHDGSLAVTAAATMVRIVCANTLSWALSNSESGKRQANTFRFRHTGTNLTAKFAEARKVMGMTVAWTKQMEILGNKLGLIPVTDAKALKVLEGFTPTKIDPEMGGRAVKNREEARDLIMAIFKGQGPDGDTSGNSGQSAWTLANAMCEWSDFGRRYTVRTDQVQRSFEDRGYKQEAIDRVMDAVL
jgi:phage/plasmid-like protein (TIGR03299 family)